MHLAGRRDREVWINDGHLYRSGEQRGRGTPAKRRWKLARDQQVFKARQEAALFGEAAVNTGAAARLVQRTDVLWAHHTPQLEVRLVNFIAQVISCDNET